MRRTALALSPHLDDAAFSCGGTLAMLARAGWRVVLATLLTRSMPDPRGFALACQLDKGFDAAVDYMAMRRAEDAAAASVLGLDPPRHVALPEAPHRGYGSPADLFGALRPDDDVARPLRSEIAALIEELAPALILAPQAIGGHVDHVQVVRALDDIAVPVLWWHDFPYTIRRDDPVRPFGARFAALPVRSVALDEEACDAKTAACLAYVSQIGFQFGGARSLEAKLSAQGAIELFRGGADLTSSGFPEPRDGREGGWPAWRR